MKRLQLAEITPETILEALDGADQDIVIYDGDVPLTRLVSIALEMKRRRDYFMFYPHPAVECFGTCWRHDGHADAEDVPEPVPVP